MADRQLAPDTPELRVRWGSFAWSQDNAKQAKGHILPDVTAIIGALDVVFGECDR